MPTSPRICAKVLCSTVLLLLMSWPGAAHAWEPMRTSDGDTVLSWPADQGFELCATGDSTSRQAVWLGAGRWWSYTGLRNPLELGFACSRDPADGTIAVESIVDAGDWDAQWGPEDQVVGFTIHTWSTTATPNLIDADIVINASGFVFDPSGLRDDAFDLPAVVAHEFGHAIGLGHPCGDPGGAELSCFNLPNDVRDEVLAALMFPSSAIGPKEGLPDTDDLSGLDALFGGLGAVPLPIAPCLDGNQVSYPGTASRWAVSDGNSAPLFVDKFTPLAVPPSPALVMARGDDGTLRIERMPPTLPACSGLQDVETDAGTDMVEDTPDAEPKPPSDCACSISATGPSTLTPFPFIFVAVLLTAFFWERTRT